MRNTVQNNGVLRVLRGCIWLTAIAGFAVHADPPVDKEWTLTFNDEFDGTDVDDTKWSKRDHFCGTRNSERHAYMPENVSVENGVIKLKAEKRDVSYAWCGNAGNTKSYASGIVITENKFSQRYGYFEASCKLPRGAAMWPAFWVLPQNPSGGMAGWPPEADIMENINQDDGSVRWPGVAWFVCNNYPDAGGGNNEAGKLWMGGYPDGYTPDLSDGFHAYGMDWGPDSLRFFLDGRQIGHTHYDNLQINHEMYMLLNLAICESFTINEAMLPCYLETDWVRVWEERAVPPDDTPPTMAPQNLQGAVLSDTEIRLSWDLLPQSADPETGIRGYAIYRDGTRVMETRQITETITGLTENTSYLFEVAGVNWRDLEGSKASVQVATLADTRAPSAAFAYASDNTHIEVYFTEPVEQASAESGSNYTLTGGVTVSSASYDASSAKVTLTTSALTDGATVTLTVAGVNDLASTPNQSVSTLSISYPTPRGVHYRTYEFDYTCELPDPDALLAMAPAKEGLLSTIAIAASAVTRTDNFAMLFTTHLLITQEADYTFHLSSDEGAAMYLNGEVLIDDGGCHPRQTKESQPVHLGIGAYPVAVVFGETTGSQTLSLQYSSAGIVKQPFPLENMLLLDNEGAAVAQRRGMRFGHGGFVVSAPHLSADGLSMRIGIRNSMANVRAAVYDLRGKQVGIIHNGSLPSGYHTLHDGISLAAGSYVCRVRLDGEQEHVPFVVKP